MAKKRVGARSRRAGIGGLIVAVAALAIVPRLRFDEPPRYDGAGYATLARSLAEGTGYRDITHPDSPPHVHFPPGYPLALAAIFRTFGPSVPPAHGFSVLCTLVAVWAFWRWWRRIEGRSVADLLGLALAANWTWARIGGSIQSEPLFLALEGMTLLLAGWTSRRGGIPRAALLGVVLGCCVLTRHVGACLVVAIGLDLWLRGRRASCLAALGFASIVVAPWVAWQARGGAGTQAELFRGNSVAGLVAGQVLFYARRTPDQVVGPFVEVATVFGRSPVVSLVATVGAFGFALLVVFGWIRLAVAPRRRLGGLIPLATLPLLLLWPFTEAGRFLIPLVPFLLIGAVEGSSAIVSKAGLSRRPRRVAAAILLAVSLPYSLYSLISDREGARIRTHADFDAACLWIASRVDHPGPILARHPADVAWLSGRQTIGIGSDDPGREIDRRGVAFLLVDDARYANAPASPLRVFAERSPDRVRLAWREGSISVFEVRPGRDAGQGGSPGL